MATLLLAAAALLAAPAAKADETAVTLKDGAGRDIVAANCGACHSLDYIQMNAPFMAEKQWEAEVVKMINAFGADIDAANAKTIVDYLTRQYGQGG
ncbi:MAG TPA: cytochrome c [Stellaceae bacterium]|nr:cytochrome c [Stellaceae bacterium]